MARKFAVPIDLQKLELRNALYHTLGGAPSSPALFQFYANSGDGFTYYWDGTAWINVRDRANHSGTQVAATISDFNTAVRTNRLDQMAAPTAAVSLNSQKITNLATPTVDTDAATKAYVDATSQGLIVKSAVRAATTANISLSGAQTIDDVAVVAGDRVLVKAQTAGQDNGIYVAAAGAWARAADADTSAEVPSGIFTFVTEGTLNDNSGWVLTTNNPITLGTTALAFAQFSGAGQITAGAGLSKTGNTLDVGAGTGITVNADDVAINTTVVARKYTTLLAGSATSYTVTHSLNNQWVVTQVVEIATSALVEVDVVLTDANTVTLGFAVAPATNSHRAIIVG